MSAKIRCSSAFAASSLCSVASDGSIFCSGLAGFHLRDIPEALPILARCIQVVGGSS